MPDTGSPYNLRYPQSSDKVNISQDFKNLADDVHANLNNKLNSTTQSFSNQVTFGDGAANGFGFAGGAKMLSGTGAPNGVVSAPVGSIWHQTDSTVGVTHWRKTSGTGNTGWSVMQGDTGWCRVTSMQSGNVTGLALGSGWGADPVVTGAIRFRRINETVHFHIRYLRTTTSSPTSSIITIPAGFRLEGWPSPATVSSYIVPAYIINNTAATWLEVSSSSITRAANTTIASGVQIMAYGAYPTDNAWPTSISVV